MGLRIIDTLVLLIIYFECIDDKNHGQGQRTLVAACMVRLHY